VLLLFSLLLQSDHSSGQQSSPKLCGQYHCRCGRGSYNGSSGVRKHKPSTLRRKPHAPHFAEVRACTPVSCVLCFTRSEKSTILHIFRECVRANAYAVCCRVLYVRLRPCGGTCTLALPDSDNTKVRAHWLCLPTLQCSAPSVVCVCVCQLAAEFETVVRCTLHFTFGLKRRRCTNCCVVCMSATVF